MSRSKSRGRTAVKVAVPLLILGAFLALARAGGQQGYEGDNRRRRQRDREMFQAGPAEPDSKTTNTSRN